MGVGVSSVCVVGVGWACRVSWADLLRKYLAGESGDPLKGHNRA